MFYYLLCYFMAAFVLLCLILCKHYCAFYNWCYDLRFRQNLEKTIVLALNNCIYGFCVNIYLPFYIGMFAFFTSSYERYFLYLFHVYFNWSFKGQLKIYFSICYFCSFFIFLNFVVVFFWSL